MSASANPFRHLLVGVDFSETAAAALESAAWAARRWQARLTMVHVVRSVMDSAAVVGYGIDWEPMMQDLAQLQHELCDDAAERLAAATAAYRTTGLAVATEIIVGRPFEQILHAAQRHECDLVIVGDRGLSPARRLMAGSTATKLARVCPWPLWVVRSGHASGVKSVLAAVDFSKAGDKALRVAVAIASSADAKLHLLHVYDTEDLHGLLPQSEEVKRELAYYRRRSRQAAFDQLRQALERCGDGQSAAELHVSQGTAWKTIAASAKRLDADLVVLGSIGRHGLPGLFVGNTAERVLHASSSSVLVVKPDEFASALRRHDDTAERHTEPLAATDAKH